MILKKLFRALVAAIVAFVLIASPAFAMSNPDAIQFYCVGTTPVYKAFYNVLEAGDMLFAAEQYVHYVVTQNISASEAFLFQLLNVAGNETIASVPLNDYEDKPISIYLTAAQVTSANLSVGGAYIIRIVGNPLIFPSTTGNIVSATLTGGDYVDQLLGADGGVATSNNLRNFMIAIAFDLETHDSPPAGSEYIITVQGVRYLTSIGGSMFITGIPGLDKMCPILFQYSTSPMTGDTPQSTGAYQSALSPLAKWGQTSADGLTNLGLYVGLNQQMAGSAMLLVLAMALAVWVYMRTESGIVVLLLMGVMPFIGAWMGLMPIALAFVFTIVLVILMGFFFFSRGAL